MFRANVRAAGLAALFGASVLFAPQTYAGSWHGWSPKKSQREKLHPGDCQFGYFGTGWRAWPEGCDRGFGYGCADRFAPTMTSPAWSSSMPPSMTPMPNMSTPSWPIQPQSETPNPWSQFAPMLQTNPPTRGPQLPPPSYGPDPTWPQSVPATPGYPTSPPFPVPSVPPAIPPTPNVPGSSGQTPVPPMPTTKAPASRGAASGIVPAGGSIRSSVPATLSAPDFGPSSNQSIQQMGYSATPRAGSSVPKPLGEAQSRRNPGPVTLLKPEF